MEGNIGAFCPIANRDLGQSLRRNRSRRPRPRDPFDVARAVAPGSLAFGKMAPGVGFEPTTSRLTAGCSTAELPRNGCRAAKGGAATGMYQTRPGDARDCWARDCWAAGCAPNPARTGPKRAGGRGRNRTDVRGFAVPCMATLPPGRNAGTCRPHRRSRRAPGAKGRTYLPPPPLGSSRVLAPDRRNSALRSVVFRGLATYIGLIAPARRPSARSSPVPHGRFRRRSP